MERFLLIEKWFFIIIIIITFNCGPKQTTNKRKSIEEVETLV